MEWNNLKATSKITQFFDDFQYHLKWCVGDNKPSKVETDVIDVAKNKDDYVSKAIEIANDENILDGKKYYQHAANEKLFNTEDVGEKFNSILKELF